MVLVILLFFVQGFKLPTENIIKGLTNYRLHVFTQIFIFVINPIYFFLLMKTVALLNLFLLMKSIKDKKLESH